MRNARASAISALPCRRLALLGLVVILIGACSVGGEQSSAAPSDTVRIVVPEEPETLEPCMNAFTSTGRIGRQNLTEGLTYRNPTSGEISPLLAIEYEQTDPQTWRFTLRDGVTFHDGSALDAEDVVATMRRVFNPELACGVASEYFGENTVQSTAVDATTVDFRTGTPDPILPLRLSFVGIVPSDTNPDARVREPIGTGPYEFGSWEPGLRLTLNRYSNYWGEEPDFATANYEWRSEATTRASMVQNGEADIATQLTALQVNDEYAVTFNTNETPYLRLDPTQPPMNDIRVREAINLAIDRQALLDTIFGGVGELASQLVPEGVVGHNPQIPVWPYDPERARALIAEAQADGVATDTPIRLIGRNGIYPRSSEAMEVVQAQLESVGLNVDIEMLEVNEWLQYMIRPFPADVGPAITQGQHGNQSGDASFTMYNNYGTNGGQSTYGTTELDAMIARAAEASGEERQQLFAEALAYQNDEVIRDAVMVRLAGVIAISPRVVYEPNSATPDELRLADVSPAQ